MPPHDRPCAAVHGPDDEATREESFFREVMNPFVRAVLNTEDPWEACESVANMRSAMTDYLVWGLHGGAVFVAWADVEDLCDTGKTPIKKAHAALCRQRPRSWPDLPSQGGATFRRHDCGNKGKAQNVRPPWTDAQLDSFLVD